MKIGIVGDVHWSKYSSIVRSRGNKYSIRLENCIESINWAETLMEQNNCELIVYLGDFFDKCDLNAEEISALGEVRFSDIPHVFLVGNHEMGINNLIFSSAHLFDLNGMTIIDKPTYTNINNVNLFFLPYILEDVRKPIKEYIDNNTYPIVFSHNDIKGIQMGNIISKMGFEIKDIEQNCKMFFNGHIHNGSIISDKIINIGNLTGQNFSEDATKYKHSIYILDTDNMSYDVFENVKAFNFFKFDVTENNIDVKKCLLNVLNPVVTIKVQENQVNKYSWVKDYAVASRVIIQPQIIHSKTNDDALESLSVNHLEKFKEYIINQFGNTNEIIEELEYVTR